MSQREICAYTLLPRQTVNNVINVFASQGLLRWGGAASTTNASSASISPTRGERYRHEVVTPVREAELQAMAALEPGECRAMIAYVNKFMSALERRIGGLEV